MISEQEQQILDKYEHERILNNKHARDYYSKNRDSILAKQREQRKLKRERLEAIRAKLTLSEQLEPIRFSSEMKELDKTQKMVSNDKLSEELSLKE
jgi:hypothetical protein